MGRSRSPPRSRSTPPSTPSSSIDSSSDPPSSSFSPCSSPPCPCNDRRGSRSACPDTDLRLGMGGSSASNSPEICIPRVAALREHRHDWPPFKPLLRSTLAGTSDNGGGGGRRPCLFVKVYMEGVPIGRKLDLLAHLDYDDLVVTLAGMFKTKISSPGESAAVDDGPEKKLYVLTYEDRDGDWMMVGDVPWEMFKSSVKRLMITRADKC